MNLKRIFNRGSESDDLEFNTPFDQWLRSTIAKEPGCTIEMEDSLASFHEKMEADKEARKNRPLIQKLAFWK